jgi:L-seryl-tRNA(Ser) seleniumtransferase
MLSRSAEDIAALAARLCPLLGARLDGHATIKVVACDSQIGSGALPSQRFASAGVAITPIEHRGIGRALNSIASAFRDLPIPVLGRIHDGRFILDFRCLEDETEFAAQITKLTVSNKA